MTETATTVALLGAGEVGTLLARDLLDAGVQVNVYDPQFLPEDLHRRLPGVTACESEAGAVAGADLVLSANTASVSAEALSNGLAGHTAGHPLVWADLNTGSPELKRELDAACRDAGVDFVDIAIMSPIAGKGLHAPLLISGDRAAEISELINSWGGKAEVATGPAGSAAAQKLTRSIFYKGMAAIVLEGLEVATRGNMREWFLEHMAQEFEAFNADTLTRLIEGTHQHSVRREKEMWAVVDYEESLGVNPRLARATAEFLRAINENT